MQEIITLLQELKLHGMLDCIANQNILQQNMNTEEIISFMLHYEKTFKQNKKIQRLLATSNLQRGIKMEDVLCEIERGLPRAKLLELMRLDFLAAHRNLLVTGATGCGKTHLANALGNKACTEGYTVKFVKLPIFLEEIQLSHQTGTFHKLLTKLMKHDLLILDDFGLTKIDDVQMHDLFNIIDERYKLQSTIVTSQLPTTSWHEYLGGNTMADAILDRLLSQSEKIELTGDSLRWDKTKKKTGGFDA